MICEKWASKPKQAIEEAGGKVTVVSFEA
ncbi:hypothetical protein ATR1_129c0001, partial [Acetobacter tropicalis]